MREEKTGGGGRRRRFFESCREVVAGEAERGEAFSVQNRLWFYSQIKMDEPTRFQATSRIKSIAKGCLSQPIYGTRGT